MARLPIPVTETQPSGRNTFRRAGASSFGGGAGLIAASQGLGQIGDALHDRQEQKELFEVNKKITDEMLFDAQDREARENNAPLGADGFTDDYIKDFNARREANISAMRASGMSEKAVQKYDNAVRRIGVSGAKQSMTFQSSSAGVKAAVDVAENTTTLSQIAQADPSQLGAVITQSDEMIDSLPNINAKLKAKLKADNKKDLEWAAGLGMVNTNPGQVVGMLSTSDTTAGGVEGYINRVKKQESDGKSTAKNPRSSATGIFQFTKGTWTTIANSSAGRAAGIQSWSKGRFDDKQQLAAMRILTRQNASILKKNGVQVSGGTLYMAHFLGPGRAVEVMQLPAGTKSSSAFTEAELEANPFLKKHTAGTFKAFTARVGGGNSVATTGKTGNPVLDSLNAVQRQRLLGLALTKQNKVASDLRGENKTRSNDATAAALATGMEVSNPLTKEDFHAARPDDARMADLEWEAHELRVAVAKTTYDFKDMSNADIAASISKMLPEDPDTPGFDLALKGQDVAKRAAKDIFTARSKDPVGYAMANDENVKQKARFVADNPQDPGRVAAYYGAVERAHDIYGTPARDRFLLPTAQAKAVVEDINDINKPVNERQATMLNTIFSTNAPDQQLRIFAQLVAKDSGLAKFQSAVEAHSRGDAGAADRLFAAGLTPVDKLATITNVTPSQINQGISQRIFSDGKIGDAVYARSSNSRGTEERQRRDGLLIADAVRSNMRNDKELEAAIDKTITDMYGPVEVLNNATNVTVTIPEGTNHIVALRGFDKFTPRLRAALEPLIRTVPEDTPPAERGDAELTETLDREHVDWIVDNGQWANGTGGYVFVDTSTGKPITGVDGKRLIVPLQDIITIGAPNQFDIIEDESTLEDIPYNPLTQFRGG